jgi:hypothetical protein
MRFDHTPPALMSTHGVPVDGDEPHAQIGNHVRVSTHPLLGLPVAPFIFDAAVLDLRRLQTRSSAVFFDRFDRTVNPPFAVTPDEPITARIVLAPTEVCLWAQVDVAGNPDLVCEAFVDSALGPASIGTRSARRYAFTGPGLVEIAISGQGTVEGLRWVEADDPQRIEYFPLGLLNLPTDSGLRYVSVVNPVGAAVDRVDHQAPKRKPLQETTNAPAPTGAPLADAAFEQARVESLMPFLLDDLDLLVNDPVSPLDQIIVEPIVDENGVEVGTSSIGRIDRVLQTQADPGTATFVGYKHRHEWFETEDLIFFYRILGFFDDSRPPGRFVDRSITEALFDAMVAAVPAENRDWSKDEFREQYTSLVGKERAGAELDFDGIGGLANSDGYFGLGGVAMVDRGCPLDEVPAPRITGSEHRNWLPTVPPDAVREVITDVAGVRVAGLLAGAKRTPPGGLGAKFDNLNKENEAGFHLPLVLSLDVDEVSGSPLSEPGTGFIADRRAGPSEVLYLVAQQDRFGRWSQWRSTVAAAGPRPRPPRPHILAHYTQPSIADAPSTGGTITVIVPVPDPDALAPGSHLLKELSLLVTDQALGTTSTVSLAESAKQPAPDDPATFRLNHTMTGPLLAPTEQRKLTLLARWVDTAGVESHDSTPRTLTLTDPRPPTQVALPDALQYSARPDVTGLAWIEHRWTPEPGHGGYGIYYSDENRLTSHLTALGRTDLIDDIETAVDAAARATVYRTNAGLFADHLFERLRDVEVGFNSGQVGFRHPVSGSLRILNFYKVAAESDSGARPDLTDLEMLVFGVPNSDPPARPSITVTPVEPESGEHDLVAEVTIELVAGATVGQTWRLRRSSMETGTLAKMPIVATGPMPGVDADAGRQTTVYRDDGPVVIADHARLRPWVRYSWVAEVQGEPESGSVAAGQPVPGRWSTASDPVSAILVPSARPDPPTITAIRGTPDGTGTALGDVSLELDHADVLAGGAIGDYTVRVARRAAPTAPLTTLGETVVSGEGPHAVSGVVPDDPGETVPSGTIYEVVLIDPIGRGSDTVTAVLS